jgi:hypothetical protein
LQVHLVGCFEVQEIRTASPAYVTKFEPVCERFSLTPHFSGVWSRDERSNRFSGFTRRVQTVETVRRFSAPTFTH